MDEQQAGVDEGQIEALALALAQGLEALEGRLNVMAGEAAALSGVLRGFTERVSAAEGRVASAAGGYRQFISGALDEWNRSVNEMAAGAVVHLETAVEDYAVAVEVNVNDFMMVFEDGTDQIDAFRSTVDTARTSMASAVGELEGQIDQLTEYAAEQVAEVLLEPLQALASAAVDDFDELVGSITEELIEPAISHLTGEFTDLIDKGLANAEKYFDDGISAVIGVMERSVQDMAGKNEVMKDLTGQLEPALQALAPMTDAVAAVADSVGIG